MKALAALQVLSDDGERVLCRGWRSEGNASARLAVLPATEHPTPASLEKLAHEYGLREELDSGWAARPVDLVHERNGTVLVLEDPGGQPLDRMLGVPMETGNFLRRAIGIAAALGKAHQRGLVHKDVKPANILVNPDNGEVRLTGFGLASRLARERQRPEPPESIAGTLAYMAPEQTGRMNRSIDSRSDLYALGVTLYEMLTGKLPFAASDPMEWVHCHIARRPAPPAEQREDVPGIVSAIIMKLLAKTPEERYQTAAGVERDLQRCLSGWEAERRINNFPLGENDTPDRLLLPEKLYGRSRDVEMLLATFNRVVADGRPELVLVSGYSGIGKSSVVNELHKSLVPPHGLFASGKFDQYKRDIPYSTLAQAFQGLIRALLSKSEGELNKWRDALHDAVGPNGKLIVNLVPELKHIIGDPPPVPDLPPQDARRRFQLVLRQFIEVFARSEHPLALFLDDLQWVDSATLDLLEDLLTQSDVRHLMLIGAYRDNEVNSFHPLMRKLDVIRKAGASVQEIVLAPLTREDLAGLITDSFHREPESATALAELIHEKTAGNPFFAIQFISALVEESLLTFDYGEGRWSWDLNRIRAKGYTDNVVDLMVGKLNRLPVETKRALQELACIGNTAQTSTLAIVRETSEEEIHSDLWEARRLELIVRSEGSYRFVHDRVQEAAYSLLPEELRASAHLRIGRLLNLHTPPEKREEAIFEIVNQFNRGTELITLRDEREQLAELNLIAAKRAKASTAYASALKFLIAGAALLTQDCWERRHDLIFQLELNRAECEFLTSEFPAADERLSRLRLRAIGSTELAAVACLRIALYTTDRPHRAVEVGVEQLRTFGIEWSAHPSEEEVRAEYDALRQRVGERPIETLVDLASTRDTDLLALMEVLRVILSPALHTDRKLHDLALLRMARLSLEHGYCDGSPLAFAQLSIVIGPRFGHYADGFRFGHLGAALVEREDLARFRGKVYMVVAYHVLPWTQPIQAASSMMQRALELAQETGDLLFVAFCHTHLISLGLASGARLDELEVEAERYLQSTRQLRFSLIIDIITTELALIRTLRGMTPKFGHLDDRDFDELRMEHHLSGNPMLVIAACWHWSRKMQARYLAGDYAAAADASSKAQPLVGITPAHVEEAEFWFYGALSHAASWDCAPPDEKQRHFDSLKAHHKQLDTWAQNCPENFENRAALVAAEIARIEGRALDAEQLYQQAIHSARANGFVHNEAIAYELAARFYAARGFEEIAHLYFGNARHCYLRWGADGKVRQLDELYPDLQEGKERVPAASGMIGTPVEHLDLATVLKVSQAVSGEIVLEKLVETLLRTAIEHAGAQRGVLILPRGDELSIQAEANTSGSSVMVYLRETPVSAAELPESVVRYAARTQESVILDDAVAQNLFSTDEYIRERCARSVLCLPLVKQGALVAVLYLENNLAPNVFTPARMPVLKVLASEAAISLDNSRLYRELQEREAEIRRLVDANIVGIFIWELEGQILEANDAFLRMLGYKREDLLSGRLRWTDLTPAEWLARDREQFVPQLKLTGSLQPFEKEYFRKDGSRVPVLLGAAAFDEECKRGVAFVVDLTERKQAEEALRRSEAFLAEGQRLSHAGSWSFKPDRTWDYWSRELYEILGFDPTSGIPTISDFLKRVHPEDRENVEATIQRMIAAGEGCDLKKRIIRPDRVQRVVRCVGMPVRENGVVTRFVGTLMDITEQEELTQELRRRQAYLEEAQRLSHTGSFGWNIVTGERTWSEETYRILGYDPSVKPTSELMRDRVHPDDLQMWEEARARAWEGKQVDFEPRLLMPDGSVKHLHVVGYAFQKDGKNVELFGIAMDITELKRAEETIRRSEAYLAEAQRLSKTGSFAWSPATDNTYYSEECYRVLGLEPQGALPPPFETVMQRIHPDDQARCRELVEKAIRDKVDVELDYRIVHSDKRVRDIHCVGHVVLDRSGELVEIVGSVIDITERKRAEAALQEARAELERVTRVTTMGELAASIAHEVNQPLTAILNNANACLGLLSSRSTGLRKMREALKDIVNGAELSGAIIERVRGMAKRSVPQRMPLRLADVVKDILSLTAAESAARAITFHTAVAPDLPVVQGDRVQLQQVLLNLVMNGMDAMSTVTDWKRRIEILGQPDTQDGRPAIRISVRDCGIGLNAGEADKLFEAFYTTKPNGMGLGLAISRSIIEAHGGRLWAESNNGPGATFILSLPADS